MHSYQISPQLFCPSCLAYLGPAALTCACGWTRPEAALLAEPDQPLWRIQLEAPMRGKAVVAGDRILFAWGRRRGAGGVTAVNRLTGETYWTVQADEGLESGPAVSEGQVFFATSSHMGLGQKAQMVCCQLEDGEIVWKADLWGGVWSTPIIQEVRLYAACESGQVICLDKRQGEPPSGWAPHLPAGRSWLLPYGELLAWLNENETAALLRKTLERESLVRLFETGVQISSPPALWKDWLVFGADKGLLMALDLHDGSMRCLARDCQLIIAEPVVDGDRVFFGAHDHFLHALDLRSQKEMWRRETMRSISAPAEVGNGLVVAADLGGTLYAWDAHSGEPAWTYKTEGRHPGLSPLFYHEGVFYFGDESGQVTALPWHLGHYRWAAERLRERKEYSQAGDNFALAAYFECQEEPQIKCYQEATDCWSKAGQFEKTAGLWERLKNGEKAAQAWYDAGGGCLMREPEKAASYFEHAAYHYFRLQKADLLNNCNKKLSDVANLPLIEIQQHNMGLREWEQGELTLRFHNINDTAAPNGIKFWLGGALKNVVEGTISSMFKPKTFWTIPLGVVPTQPESILIVEIEYQTGVEAHPVLRGMLPIVIRAGPASKEPLRIGDVGSLIMNLGTETLEGLRIVTRDVGIMRSQGEVGSIKTEGDIGYIGQSLQ